MVHEMLVQVMEWEQQAGAASAGVSGSCCNLCCSLGYSFSWR